VRHQANHPLGYWWGAKWASEGLWLPDPSVVIIAFAGRKYANTTQKWWESTKIVHFTTVCVVKHKFPDIPFNQE